MTEIKEQEDLLVNDIQALASQLNERIHTAEKQGLRVIARIDETVYFGTAMSKCKQPLVIIKVWKEIG